MTKSILSKHAADAAKAIQTQIEYELRGAWRAGYDYLHVYDDLPTELGRSGIRETFTIRQYVFPSNTETPPRPDTAVYRYTYDIGAVDDD